MQLNYSLQILHRLQFIYYLLCNARQLKLFHLLEDPYPALSKTALKQISVNQRMRKAHL